ncbi:MAG: GNAT family N-acetyltransferase, partial [Phycisphaerales bacterium]|nr:GNAT family N-acetyltransferase [Phycisphaerales bacterium]
HVPSLAKILNACVRNGASVSFILPHSLEESRAFWTETVRPPLMTGHRTVWVAKRGKTVAGTVQLDCGTPPNQPHRAEVSKLLVHPDFRRQGIARKLMNALEDGANEIGRSLLTLDTASQNAEALYLSLGYQRVGVIPGFAKDPVEDRYDATTVMFKPLRG